MSFFRHERGTITIDFWAYIVSREEIQKTVQLISQGSIYAFEEEFRQGFLTLPGGHRLALPGERCWREGS